jgi:hypothetical protein
MTWPPRMMSLTLTPKGSVPTPSSSTIISAA